MTDKPDPKVSRLAQRFQAAIDQEVAAERIAAEQERLERERLEQTRGDLLADLAAFGEAVSWFEVERGDGWVTLSYQQRSLRFEAVGQRGKVKVIADGLEGDNKLFLQEPIGRWVWSREDRYGREHREMLFDAGLEKLVSVVFDVAPLAEDAMPAGQPAPTADDERGAELAVPFPDKTL